MNDQQKDAFYLAIRQTGLEATSAKAAGVTLRAVHREYENDPAFHEDCLDSMELQADILEQEAIRRAVEGTTKGIYYQGDRVDDEQVYSDTLLAKLLTGRRPTVFGDKREISGAGGGAIQVVIQEFSNESAHDHDFL